MSEQAKETEAAAEGAATTDSAQESGKTPLGAEKTEPEAKAEGAAETDEASKDGDGAEGESKESEEAAASVDLSKIAMPEGVAVDEKWMGKLGELPFISKLSQEDAQSMIDTLGEYVGELEKGFAQRHVQEQIQRVADWTKAIQEHPYVMQKGGLDKIVPLAVAARDAFFSDLPEFKDLLTALNESGLGAHPAMVVGLARAAERMELAEGVPLGGGRPNAEGGKKRAADKLFPDFAPGGRYA